jgi:hypothetical protein
VRRGVPVADRALHRTADHVDPVERWHEVGPVRHRLRGDPDDQLDRAATAYDERTTEWLTVLAADLADLHLDALGEHAVVDPHPPAAQAFHHRQVVAPLGTDVCATVEAGPEVVVEGVDRVAVDGVHVAAVAVELRLVRTVGATRGLVPVLVRVGVGADPPRLALGEQAVPQSTDGRGHPVEAAPGAVAFRRVAGEGVRVRRVAVQTTGTA